MILLVCGGRDYRDRQAVIAALDKVHSKTPVTTLVHGGAQGADWCAMEWAIMRRIAHSAYRVTKEDWKQYGKAAGPRRNAVMLEHAKPEGVVAFPGGAGTADMVRQARAAGLKVWFPYPERKSD